MDSVLILALLSCLASTGSLEDIPVYYAVHPGRRYANVSRELFGTTFAACSSRCIQDDPAGPCRAFNHRERDGACQLVHGGRSQLVLSEGFLPYAQCESSDH